MVARSTTPPGAGSSLPTEDKAGLNRAILGRGRLSEQLQGVMIYAEWQSDPDAEAAVEQVPG
jgi:hypothetical protein